MICLLRLPEAVLHDLQGPAWQSTADNPTRSGAGGITWDRMPQTIDAYIPRHP